MAQESIRFSFPQVAYGKIGRILHCLKELSNSGPCSRRDENPIFL